MDCHFRDLPDVQSSEARLMTASAAHAEAVINRASGQNSGNRANPENDSP